MPAFRRRITRPNPNLPRPTRNPGEMLEALQFHPFGHRIRNYILAKYDAQESRILYCQAAYAYLEKHPEVCTYLREFVKAHMFVEGNELIEATFNQMLTQIIYSPVHVQESLNEAIHNQNIGSEGFKPENMISVLRTNLRCSEVDLRELEIKISNAKSQSTVMVGYAPDDDDVHSILHIYVFDF